MPNILCPEVLNQCLPCNDDPVRNISAEDVDTDAFLFNIDVIDYPPLGWTWGAYGCKRWCYSTESQEAAELCARLQATECIRDTWNQPNPNPIDPNVPGAPAPRFTNNVQTCTSTCPDGTTMGYTISSGVVVGSSQQEADRIAFSLACNFARLHKVCITISAALRAGCVDTPYSNQLTSSGGRPLYVAPETFVQLPPDCLASGITIGSVFAAYWTITGGSLPPGLSLNHCSGIISGTPTVAGSYSFTVSAMDADGFFQLKGMTLTIAEITNDSPLDAAAIGATYSVSFTITPTHDQETESWTVTAGTLPPGLELTTAGVLHGTPTFEATEDAYDFTVKGTFTLNGLEVTCTKEFHLPMLLCVEENAIPFGCPANVAGKRLAYIISTPAYPLFIDSLNRVVIQSDDGVHPLAVVDFSVAIPVVERYFDSPAGGTPRVLGEPFYNLDTDEVIAVVRTGAGAPFDVHLCFFNIGAGTIVSDINLGTTNSIGLTGSNFVAVSATGKIALFLKQALVADGIQQRIYLIDPDTRVIDTQRSTTGVGLMLDYSLCYVCKTRQLMLANDVDFEIQKFDDVTLAHEGTIDALHTIDALNYIDGTEKLWSYSRDNVPTEMNVIDPVTGLVDSTVVIGTGNMRGHPVYNIKLGQWMIGMEDIDFAGDNGVWMYNVHTFVRTCDIRRDWDQADQNDEMGDMGFDPATGIVYVHSATGAFHLEQLELT